MARKNAIVTHTINEDGTITFSAGGKSFNFNPAERSEEQRQKAMYAGYVNKVTLGAAISKDELPSDPAEAAALKFAGMQAVADRLVNDEWSKRGEGGGQPSGVIFRAYEEWVQAQAAKKGVEAPTSEKLRSVYDAKTRAEQLALRNVPAIAKIIERIKSESGAGKTASVDTADLLGEVFD